MACRPHLARSAAGAGSAAVMHRLVAVDGLAAARHAIDRGIVRARFGRGLAAGVDGDRPGDEMLFVGFHVQYSCC